MTGGWVDRRDSVPSPPVDRPRYRALAHPYHVDDPVDGSPQLAGYELTVYRVDGYWRSVGGAWAHEPIGVTQTPATVTGGLDPHAARLTVVDYLRTASDPRPCGVTVDDVELYREVAPP